MESRDHVTRVAGAARRVSIPTGSVTLEGDWQVPRGAFGLVLFAHGSGSSRLSPRNQFVASALRAAGAGTLLFDLLTREEEAIDAATGALKFDPAFLGRRLREATRWALRQPEAAGLAMGYFGSSTGAAAALVASTETGHPIAAIVCRGGRPDLARAALSQVTAATLLIVGERDEEVLALNRDAYSRLRCLKDLVVVPGATHLFAEPGALARVAQLAADWFQRHLGTGARSCGPSPAN